MIRRNLVQSISELIFSKRCPICKKISQSENYICNECYIELRKKGKIKNIGRYYYLYYYDEKLKNLIADFKLKNRKNLAREIGMLMKRPLKDLILEKKVDMVLPVPISKARENERGFNQVELLLDECGIKYQKIKREKNTRHMYELFDSKSRRENIYNAFQSRELNFDGKIVLIVDDIVTTGSTIREMEKEIKKISSPKELYVFSLAISKGFKL